MSPKQSGNSTSSAAANKNVLPPKEQNLFKSVVRFYETKQLKKALKAADTVLKKFPDHGETLAMKGLTLNALDKKSEAIDYVRRGLRMDMRSHICWHVYGLLYRSERDYREAAKAYLNALRIDKDNQQILKDLSLLQIQIRDYDGLYDTRRRLLTVRPNQGNNWIGFALSIHLLGNPQNAVSVLDTYHNTLPDSPSPEDRYETSELLLYKNMILEENAQYADALSHLDEVADKLFDRLAVREARARLLAALGRFDAAAEQLRTLLKANPDNQYYHHALHTCAIYASRQNGLANGSASPDPSGESAPPSPKSVLPFRPTPSWKSPAIPQLREPFDEAAAACALSICDELTVEAPRSRTAQRIALDILPDSTHPEFLPRVDAYVRPFLRKGIPSLFSDVKSMYTNVSKVTAFEELFSSYRISLEDKERLCMPAILPMPPSNPIKLSTGPEPAGEEESPSTLLWVLHFLAQHYDRIGKRDLALETIEAAIQHTPTAIECHLVKARILKHMGDLKAAVEITDEARNMDLADRYLNTKCAKYGLRADMVSEAEGWVSLFTRDGDSGGVQALYDMQCMWFELEAAESHLRRGQTAQALKKFTAVERHFADMVEDQFDFHLYCLRKVTLRAYVTLLRFEDRIRGHPYYARASSGMARCLLRLMDMTSKERTIIIGENSDIKGYAEMTDAQRKKAVSKRKKQLARQRQSNQSSGAGKTGGKHGPGDGDKGQGGDGKSASNGSANDNKSKANAGWMEADPNGLEVVKELLKDSEKENRLMDEATRVIRDMQLHLESHIQTQEFVFDLALRKKKYLQALRAARRASAIDADSPVALHLAVRLAHELGKEGVREGFSEVVAKVYEAVGDVLQGAKAIGDFVAQFLKRNEGHAKPLIGAHKVRLWMARSGVDGAPSLEEASSGLCAAIESAEGAGSSGMNKNVASASMCKQLVDELRMDGYSTGVLEKVVASCRRKHPRASCF